jgi:hypothetical protein
VVEEKGGKLEEGKERKDGKEGKEGRDERRFREGHTILVPSEELVFLSDTKVTFKAIFGSSDSSTLCCLSTFTTRESYKVRSKFGCRDKIRF